MVNFANNFCSTYNNNESSQSLVSNKIDIDNLLNDYEDNESFFVKIISLIEDKNVSQ